MLIYYERMLISCRTGTSGSNLRQRPVPVTIIAWIEIVGGIVAQMIFVVASFVSPRHVAAVVESRVPFEVQTVLSEVGILIMITSGIGMLKGFNWARSIYFVWAGLALVRAVTLFHITPQQLIIFGVGCAKYAAFLYFLMRPDANRYFRGSAPSNSGYVHSSIN